MKGYTNQIERPTNSITTMIRVVSLLTLLCAPWAQATLSASLRKVVTSPSASKPGSGPSMSGLVFTPSGILNVPRYNHTATMLTNGKVLVAGGVDERTNTVTDTTELYDPATGRWTQVTSMKAHRARHTATLLPNGEVLVVGGASDQSSAAGLRTAELYNPMTGNWRFTSTSLSQTLLADARQEHTATLLRNGKVLVTGGYSDVPALSSVELYDIASGIWSRLPDEMFVKRYNHTATLLDDGTVLIAGGMNESLSVNSNSEVYDPSSQTLGSPRGLQAPHYHHTATRLPDGNVLLAGGAGSEPIAEIYETGPKAWRKTKEMTALIDSHTANLLPNGKVLVAGSDNGFTDASQIYDPATDEWTAVFMTATRYLHTGTLLPNGQVLIAGDSYAELFDSYAGNWDGSPGDLSAFRSLHTATLLPDGKVLIAGGFGGNNSADLYDPVAKIFGAIANTLTFPRYGHTATLLQDGRVLVAGGYGPLKSAEIYDPLTKLWSNAGEMSTARIEHTATLLPNGKVLIVGGATNVAPGRTKDCELYDPAKNQWESTGPMKIERGRHTATLLPNGKVLVAGGTSVSDPLKSWELYDPDSGLWSANVDPRFNMNTVRREHKAILLPSGEVLVVGGIGDAPGKLNSAELFNPSIGTWTPTGNLNTERYEFTATLLANGKVLVAGGFSNSARLKSAEVYDPATRKWSNTLDLNTERYEHTATLLANGKVLVTGGLSNSGENKNAELFDIGLGFDPGRQPSLDSATSLVGLNTKMTASGTRFRNVSEASGGNHFNSASNYPLLQLTSLSNEQTKTISSITSSDTSFTSAPVTDLHPGLALATIFTNGIPSSSQIILIVGATRATAPAGGPVTVQAGPITITFENVSAEGTVTVTPIDVGSAGTPPAGFVIDNNSSAFEITGPAGATGMITICFKLPTINDRTVFDKLMVLHNVNGTLVDETIDHNFATRTLCARTNSLSPFIIARQVNQVLTCPNNITKNADPGQCSAIVTYPQPTGVPAPTCIPASGTSFPKGTTTVMCTATATSGNTSTCSFTVTVNDAQAPSVSCPSNVTSVTSNIGGVGAVVTYSNPSASDNCPNVATSCNPPSGSTFPTGCTTVICTATDTSGNTATCTFQVCVFNVCLQDDSNPNNRILINTLTGDYRICCGGLTYTGKGKILAQGSNYTLDHNTVDRRVRASVTGSSRVGTASLQSPPGSIRCNISDGNTSNNTMCSTCQ